MDSLYNIGNLVLIALAVAGAIAALVSSSRAANHASRVEQLEKDLTSRDERLATLSEQVTQQRRELARVTELAEQAGVTKNKMEAALGEKSREKKTPRDDRRVRDLENQLQDLRKQLDTVQSRARARDEDVKRLHDDLVGAQVERDEAHRSIADLERRLAQASARREEEEEPVVLETPTRPEVDTAEIDARMAEARRLAESAEKIRHDAIGRANLAEFEARRLKEQLDGLGKRSREVLERLIVAERSQQKLSRQAEAWQKQYLGLKGRYEVVRDTLFAFREKFGVELPAEAGVPVGSEIEAFLELDEEDRVFLSRETRPRQTSAPAPSGGRGRRGPRPESTQEVEVAKEDAPSSSPVETESRETPAHPTADA